MTGPGRVCANGHPSALPDQRFCETCGAPFVGFQAPAPPSMPPPPPPIAAWPQPGQVPPPAPPAAPPAWAPAPVGWAGGPMPPNPPAPRGGGALGPILLGLFLVLVVAGGAAAFVLIAHPFGVGSASPSPSAFALVSASPSSPLAATTPSSATPSAAPTPSVAPSDSPAETPAQTPATPEPSVAADSATCRSETAGITVIYPAAWHAYSGDARWTCLLFDPNPITITPDSELPMVGIAIFSDTRSAATVLADYKTTSVYTLLNSDTGTVDGKDAWAYEVENTGEGYYQKGVRQTVVVVDRGSRGSLILETVGNAGEPYDTYVQVLRGVVDAIKID